MTDTNIVLLQSIRSDLEQAKLISQNIANANTPGYKSIKSNAIDFLKMVDVESMSNLPNSNELVLINTDNSQGQIKNTGRNLDLSVNGGGFMLVQKNDTEYLIASQNFYINIDGNLATSKGSILIGNSGPIEISSKNIQITSQGEIYDGDRLIDQIKIVTVPDTSETVISQHGLIASSGVQDASFDSIKVVQGQLQMSNVDSSQQMIKLMQLTKHIESNQRAFSTLEQILDTGINQIGKR